MSEKVLLNSRYKEFEVPESNSYANRFYQKKISDKKGIKYFIDVYEYEIQDSLMYEFELHLQKRNFWINTTLYGVDNMTIEEIEKEIENIWVTCKMNYYERYEDGK